MKRTYKIGFAGASFYMIFELILVLSNLSHHNYAHIVAFGLNSLILLAVVTITVLTEYNKIKFTNPTLIHDIKNGIQATVIYALTIAIFIFCYYKWIDPEYPEIKKQQLMELTMNEKEMQKIANDEISNNPEFYDGKSAEDLIEMQQQNISETMEPSKVFPITLFSLILLGVFFTFFVTAFNRLILSRIK